MDDDLTQNQQAMENNNRWAPAQEGLRTAADIRRENPDSQPDAPPEEPGHIPVRETYGEVIAEPPDGPGPPRRGAQDP